MNGVSVIGHVLIISPGAFSQRRLSIVGQGSRTWVRSGRVTRRKAIVVRDISHLIAFNLRNCFFMTGRAESRVRGLKERE